MFCASVPNRDLEHIFVSEVWNPFSGSQLWIPFSGTNFRIHFRQRTLETCVLCFPASLPPFSVLGPTRAWVLSLLFPLSSFSRAEAFNVAGAPQHAPLPLFLLFLGLGRPPCLPICLSVCLPVCLSLCLSPGRLLQLRLSLSFSLSLSLSLSLSPLSLFLATCNLS